MWNNTIFSNGLRFVVLVMAQVLVFNRLNIFGYINPMVYVLFFYWYPIRTNRPLFLFVGFLLGFFIDVFSDTMALHAIAGLTLAFVRPLIIRFCFGANYELQGLTFKNTTVIQRITFLLFLILVQHLLFFTFEILSLSHILLIFKKVSFTALATLMISILLSSLFSREHD